MARSKLSAAALLLAGAALALWATPSSAKDLTIHVDSIKKGGLIPTQYAFCVPAKQGHSGPGHDISPHISWSKGPAGTKSYAIIVYDSDVPSVRDNMNKEGVMVAASTPRMDFYHWVLVDIPATVTSLKMGEDSDQRVVHGKPQNGAKVGLRGLNDYSKFTKGNPNLAGDYYGYDGPCPPWNDEIAHHYHFAVFALSVPTLGLSGGFTGQEARTAMEGKVLAKGELMGLYAQNPDVIAKLKK
jgi:hypothetical protein